MEDEDEEKRRGKKGGEEGKETGPRAPEREEEERLRVIEELVESDSDDSYYRLEYEKGDSPYEKFYDVMRQVKNKSIYQIFRADEEFSSGIDCRPPVRKAENEEDRAAGLDWDPYGFYESDEDDERDWCGFKNIHNNRYTNLRMKYGEQPNGPCSTTDDCVGVCVRV